MKKYIVTGLITAMLGVSNMCSAAWVYVGDYIVDKGFERMVGNPEYVYSTVYNLNSKPSDHIGMYYRFFYDDGYELNKSNPNSDAYYVGLKVRTCLVPIYSSGESASGSYGLLYDNLYISNKGVFGVTVKKHSILDRAPRVQQPTVRLSIDFSTMQIDNFAGHLGVLKKGSAIEAVCKRIDNGINGM